MLINQPTRMSLKKDEFKTERENLRLKLGELQRRCKNDGRPVVILISGPSAAGKGRMAGELVRGLDPRGFELHKPTSTPDDQERYPYLWRFWNRLPANGNFAIFLGSWYRLLLQRHKGFRSTKDQRDWCRRLNTFERQLTDDGCLVIKFYLHISSKELKQRLEKLAASKSTAWRVTAEDLHMAEQFDRYLKNADNILEATHTVHSPWTILPADNWRYAALTMHRVLTERLEQEPVKDAPTLSVIPDDSDWLSNLSLKDADLSRTMSREEYDACLERLQNRLRFLHHELYRRQIPVAIAYEGWDAAGKGGNIKRLVRGLDPRGYTVVPIGAPEGDERKHHYLWRFWKKAPRRGHIEVFDRTWYGRVLVERVERLCSAAECERAYSEIVEMEREWVESGVVLLKFWIHIDKEEQLRRFEERMNTPHKRWKITDEDWRNREKWDEYEEAVNLMLGRTHSQWAPWTVVESNCKLFARIKVLQTVVDAIEARM